MANVSTEKLNRTSAYNVHGQEKCRSASRKGLQIEKDVVVACKKNMATTMASQ